MSVGTQQGGLAWATLVDRFCASRDSPSTKRLYLWNLRKCFGRLGIVYLSDLRLEHLEELRACVMEGPDAPKSKKCRISAMRSFLKWASMYDLHSIPMDRVEYVLSLPKSKTINPRRSLADEDAAKLMAAVDGRDRVMLGILLTAGLRVSELCRLRVEDWLPESRLLHIKNTPEGDTKNHEERMVPLPPSVAVMVTEWCAHRPLSQRMFLSTKRKGAAINPPCVREVINRATLTAGLPHAFPHQLRHTALFRFYMATKDLVATARLAGHKDISTTKTYLDHHDVLAIRDAMPDLP